MTDTNSAYSAPIPSRKQTGFHQRRSAEERRSWVKRYERSGQTLKQFCQQHGLALSSFCLWKQQLKDGNSSSIAVRGGLVEVPVPLSCATTAIVGTHSAVIHCPHGLRVEIAAHTDVAWVGELVAAVLTLRRSPK